MIIYGYHSIVEAINESVPIHSIYVDIAKAKRNDRRFIRLKELAKALNIKVQEVPKEKLLSIDKEGADTGFIALLSEVSLIPFDSFDFRVDKNSLIVALDEVTDTGNFGSIIRSCAFFGVDALIVTERNSPPINAQVVKISSGGAFKVPIVRTKNLVRAIEDLKDRGFWTVSLTPHAGMTICELPSDLPFVVIAGNEERGIRRLILERSDYRVKIEGSGKLESLNVAVSLAIAIATIKMKKGKC
ncbi:MAG: 23S rRNA (guanosine(2251)-2'-O)-methyltransferase RlmB [Thermosulfidibacteraceae bacterium]|jgi:23S rRNA (guanosine2251-2'-O)-methyltransferase